MREIQKLELYEYPTKYLKNGKYKQTKAYQEYQKKKKRNGSRKGLNKPKQYALNKNNQRIKVGPKDRSREQWDAISGQSVYSGMNNQLRTAMVGYLKDFFRPEIIKSLRPFKQDEYPLMIECELHTTVNRMWDCSNMWIYGKVFEDTLSDEGIIEDDSNYYITFPPTAPFLFPVEKWEERKIVFRFVKDERDIIKNHKKWR